MTASQPASRLTPYQRRLVVFLSVATFFEGYDFLALSQLLPTLRAELGIPIWGEGWLVSFISLGTILSYFLVRRADRLGRRRVLLITIVGYTLCTAASGLSRTVWDFAIFQFLARIFLIAEWAITMVIAAEEFPAGRRGSMIGIIQAMSSLGSICCALLVAQLPRLPFGWRTVYLISIAPLVLMMFARRGLRESARFQSAPPPPPDLMAIFATPYRKRVLQLALIWGCVYVCSNNTLTFFNEFARHDLHLTAAQAGQAVSIAAGGSLPLLFFAGKLLDWLGRRGGAMVILPLLALGSAGAYQLHAPWAMTASLLIAVFGIGASLPLLNAYTSELFPTELRGAGFAWANNLLGRIAYVLSPAAIGHIAHRTGYGPALTVTCLFPMVALLLILLWLPETRNRELEHTAQL